MLYNKNVSEYHVSISGSDENDGSIEKPFRTILMASKHATAGDTVVVHGGVYREWVDPLYGGDSDLERITYQAAEGEKAVIKGSEIINNWEWVSKGVWKVVIDNSYFGDYNPYDDEIYGDWFDAKGRIHHTGEVYLNEKSMFEVDDIDKVFNPKIFKNAKNKEFSIYTWYCEKNSSNTVIWANFHKYNPNKELVEINVRPCCFFPKRTGVNYITVRGFHMSQAATQWAPPTAEQIGLIGVNWSKGWIIENNVISNSKCTAISLGKERTTGHNFGVLKKQKSGFQYQLEAVFSALRIGWNKDNVGSHIVRNNIIFDCEQAGVVGNMGCVYSEIYNNHIYNIWTKRQFGGAEIAGIKFHVPIDVVIKNNRINDCGLGLWMDWQAQGTRISKNLLYNNDKDLMIEVCHGPCLIDNNIFMSEFGIDLYSQGMAFVHNIIAGKVSVKKVPNRATPYHAPHSTWVCGTAFILGGDDRFYNNLFVNHKVAEKVVFKKDEYEIQEATGETNDQVGTYGLQEYNEYNSSMDEYKEKLRETSAIYGLGTVSSFLNVEQPVFIDGNVYFNGSMPYKNETNVVVNKTLDPDAKIIENNDEVYLYINMDTCLWGVKRNLVTSKTLGKTIMSQMEFENFDGSSITLDKDYNNIERSEENILPGPFAKVDVGANKIKVW